MFKLWHLIQEMRRFSRGAQAFLGESERLLEEHDPDEAASLRRSYRRILVFAVLFPVVGLIAVLATPWLAAYRRGDFPDTTGVQVATFLGLMVFFLPGFYYLFAGVAVGCMLAPDEFMDSSVGQKWLKLIGTRSYTTARLVCLLAALVGLAIMVGMVVLQVLLVQSEGLRRGR